MKYLFLLRHGHATSLTWRTDKQRELSARGREEVASVARFLESQSYPDAIIASDAARTKGTMDRFCKVSGCTAKCITTPKLYNCHPNNIIDIVSNCDDSIAKLMVVGHNPSITSVIDYIGAISTNPILETMARDYHPTAKLVVLRAEIQSWQRLLAVTWEIETVFWPGIPLNTTQRTEVIK